MSAKDSKAIVAAGEEGGGGGGGVSLGKGAWDCAANVEIPPEKEAYVFEEIATMDFPFEGIPTVPPRKDMDHLAFFCGGCRYRVTAYPDWTAARVSTRMFVWTAGRDVIHELGALSYYAGGSKWRPVREWSGRVYRGCRSPARRPRPPRELQVKQALFKGGIARSNKPAPASNTPGIHKWEDLELIYAGQRMADGKTLAEYHVPPVSHAIFEYAHAPVPYL